VTVVPTGRFKIEPDPPQAGQKLEVTYIGPADEVEWQVDGQDPVAVTPDDNGKFTIDPVPDGDDLWLSDNRGLPGYLHREILGPN
jgi:hypothetical protein